MTADNQTPDQRNSQEVSERRIFNGVDRAATAEMFGFALYLGEVKDGWFTAVHQGFVGTAEEAEAWVRGEEVEATKLYQHVEGPHQFNPELCTGCHGMLGMVGGPEWPDPHPEHPMHVAHGVSENHA